MKRIFGLIFLLSNILYSQNLDYNNGYESVRICTAIQGNNFVSEKSADESLTKILSVIGASKRFVLQECSNINNAVALTLNGVRYIMYDPEFMSELKYSSDWTNMFILAHEVGHHINGHSVDVILSSNGMGKENSLSTKRIQELEADEFAGFVLGRLGATLSQTQSVMKTISSDGDDSYSTHPSRSKRLNAIKRGFENSGGYVNSSNLDIKKGKTIDSPYSNRRFSNVTYTSFTMGSGVYIGYVNNRNIPHGYGRVNYNDGGFYEGEFVDGSLNGYGKQTWVSGSYYEGYWVNDVQNGEGTYVFSDGEKRSGVFSNGKFVRGILTWTDGEIEEGFFNGSRPIKTTFISSDSKKTDLGFLDGSMGNGYTTFKGRIVEVKGNFKDGYLVPQIGMGYGESGTETLLLSRDRRSHKKKQLGGLVDFIPDEILDFFGNKEEVGLVSKRYKYNKSLSYAEIISVYNYTYKGYVLSSSLSFDKYGYGELTAKDLTYKGMFWNGYANGYGILTKSDGTVQRGLFKNNEFIKNEDFDFEWMQRTMKRW